jgi:P27 family predicted phage terminase small subunit
MRGRPPKPTETKRATGMLRPDRSNPTEPKPEIVLLAPPVHLGPVARATWELVAAEMYQIGTLARLDAFVLEAFCQSVATYRQAQATLDRAASIDTVNGGLYTRLSNDYVQMSAWVLGRDRALDRVVKLANELGLSPTSRTRVSAAPPLAHDDPADEFFEPVKRKALRVVK